MRGMRMRGPGFAPQPLRSGPVRRISSPARLPSTVLVARTVEEALAALPRVRPDEVLFRTIPDDLERKSEVMRKMFQANPGDARFYNVELDGAGNPHPEHLRQAAEKAVLLRIDLDS